jgi:hypothetical protein
MRFFIEASMRHSANHFVRAALLLVLLASALIMTGCASSESANVSERPWNSPQGWESGMPGAFIPPR